MGRRPIGERALTKAEIQRQVRARRARETLALKAEIYQLRAVLAYYAAPQHWDSGEVPGHIYAHDDAGASARRALGLPERFRQEDTFDIELKCREMMRERD